MTPLRRLVQRSTKVEGLDPLRMATALNEVRGVAFRDMEDEIAPLRQQGYVIGALSTMETKDYAESRTTFRVEVWLVGAEA